MSSSAAISSGTSTSASASAASPAAAAAASTALAVASNLPHDKTLKHAAIFAIEQDKPIMLDYFKDTCEGKACIGKDPKTNEQILVRSDLEYTSKIEKVYKVAGNGIVVTENSIYIISGATLTKSVNIPSSY